VCERERERDGQNDRQAQRMTEPERGIHRERERDRQIDRQSQGE